ncbi:collagen alpha 1(I) chain precursor [Cutibacterium acnes JCM 18918]|nr:collagen alpha 1(I) chain precursor [Cutibacterium acnes JCM 18918]
MLQRLETLLALIEGWVDEVTFQVARTWLPSHDQLAEAVRRRRAHPALQRSSSSPCSVSSYVPAGCAMP